ncbi:hypothetical protein BOX15_Mlig011272g2 [Macrostomum lignano]|uniref:PH domain-containing protein n=2 Tax=Macrostomum lignano TaxID=282301 RepID=A0A1I8J3L1_9PLAT|nr:hypothetical protein BOX15_Mlig011272g2 [Macrostomum lignano]
MSKLQEKPQKLLNNFDQQSQVRNRAENRDLGVDDKGFSIRISDRKSSTEQSESSTCCSSSADGYDSVCDDCSVTDGEMTHGAAVVSENCNNSGIGFRQNRELARARLRKRRLRKLKRMKSQRSLIGRDLSGASATANNNSEGDQQPRNQQQLQLSTSTATDTLAAVDNLRGRMDNKIRSAIDNLNGTFDSLMQLNASENCCRGRQSVAELDESEISTDWVAAEVSPAPEIVEDFEGPHRQTTSELSSCGSSSWCPLNVLYDRQHYYPGKKQRELQHKEALAAVALRRQNRRQLRHWQKQQPKHQLVPQLLRRQRHLPKKPKRVRQRRSSKESAREESDLVLQEQIVAEEVVQFPLTAGYLAKRLDGLEALLLTMQENSSGQNRHLLLRLKRKVATYNDALLLLNAKELHGRVQQQHRLLQRRWNFRRNWGPIAAASRKMCSAAKDGYVPEGGATQLDRRDRWLLRFLPDQHRGILPRLLEVVEFNDDYEEAAADVGIKLKLPRARGRGSTACHNMRDAHEDAIRRYKYAVLS